MSGNNKEQEALIVKKDATKAPRITMVEVEAAIRSEYYFNGNIGLDSMRFNFLIGNMSLTAADECCRQELLVFAKNASYAHICSEIDEILNIDIIDDSELSRTTFCMLVLNNGYTVYGSSSVANKENFVQEIGNKIARNNALGKIFEILGYQLKDKNAAADKEPMDLLNEDKPD